MEVNKLEEEEGQCPGCGTTWVGHSGFGPTSGEFPSKNAMSCPVHRAAPKFLDALKASADRLHSLTDEPECQGHIFRDCSTSYCVEARDVIQEAKGHTWR